MRHSLVFKKRKATKSGMKFLLDLNLSNEIPIVPYLVSAFIENVVFTYKIINIQHG